MIGPYDFHALLTKAEELLGATSYQSRFIAAKLQTLENGKKKLQFCSPLNDDAMLSLRGALIRAAGEGKRAWPIIEWLRDEGLLHRMDPASRRAALDVILEAKTILARERLAS